MKATFSVLFRILPGSNANMQPKKT